jgi:hypothetical protein
MKRAFILGVCSLFLAACGSGGSTSTSTPDVNTTGTWSGSISSNLISPARTANIVYNQTGTNATGTYTVTPGTIGGTVAGTVSGNNLTFTLTSTGGCTGTLLGTATITTPSVGQPTMHFTYTGTTTCGAESGSGDLTKQ